MKAYIISLPERQQSHAVPLARRLSRLGLDPVISPGVRTSPAGGMSAGEHGCLRAHMNVWRTVVRHGQNACVFEDDAMPLICMTPTALDLECRKFMERYNAPAVLLGATQYKWKNIIKWPDHYYADRYTNGSFARILSPEVCETALSLIDSGVLDTVDGLFKNHIYEVTPCPVSVPNMFIADVSSSVIRGPRDAQAHARQSKWVLGMYDRTLPTYCIPPDVKSTYAVDAVPEPLEYENLYDWVSHRYAYAPNDRTVDVHGDCMAFTKHFTQGQVLGVLQSDVELRSARAAFNDHLWDTTEAVLECQVHGVTTALSMGALERAEDPEVHMELLKSLRAERYVFGFTNRDATSISAAWHRREWAPSEAMNYVVDHGFDVQNSVRRDNLFVCTVTLSTERGKAWL